MKFVVATVLLVFSLAAQANVCQGILASDYSQAIAELATSYVGIEKAKIEGSASATFIKKMTNEIEAKKQELIALVGQENFDKKFNAALLREQGKDLKIKKYRKEKIIAESEVLEYWVEAVSEAFTDHVSSVAFSPDGLYIAIAAHDKWLRILDANTGNLLRKIDFEKTEGLDQVEFSPDGKTILVTEVSRPQHATHTYYVDFATGKILNSFRGYGLDHRKYSPYGELAVITDNTNKKVIDLKTSQLWEELYKNRDMTVTYAMSAAKFSTDGKKLVTTGLVKDGDRDLSLIEIWDTQTRQLKKSFKLEDASVENARLSPNGKYIVAVAERSELLLINTESGEHVRNDSFGLGFFYDTEFINDQYLALYALKIVYVWDLEKNRHVEYAQEENIKKISIHKIQKTLMIQTHNYLKFIEPLTGKILDTVVLPTRRDLEVTKLDVSPNGEAVAVGLSNGKVVLMKKLKVTE